MVMLVSTRFPILPPLHLNTEPLSALRGGCTCSVELRNISPELDSDFPVSVAVNLPSFVLRVVPFALAMLKPNNIISLVGKDHISDVVPTDMRHSKITCLLGQGDN